MNILLMDPYDNAWAFPPIPQSQFSQWAELRQSIGRARILLSQLDLSTMVPHAELSSTHYCLADPSSGVYLVYLPSRAPVEIDTGPVARTFEVEWFEPSTGKALHPADVAGKSIMRFAAPFAADSVLLLKGLRLGGNEQM